MAPAISDVSSAPPASSRMSGDQGDAGAVDAQTGKTPQCHSGISGGEDSQDEEGHVGGNSRRSSGQRAEMLHNT